jgi:methionyl-tRNA formyltransferase
MRLRIVFMGTPLFSSYMLARILETDHEVLGVVTVADKPAGRGQKVKESEVKKLALSHQIPLWQPLSLKDERFLNDMKSLEADVFVVVAFRMLPEKVWSIPSRGTINLHASLLPQFRGAAPINWAIIEGESESGLTTFFINEHIDEGPILLQCSIPVSETTTAGTLHDAMLPLGASLLIETLEGIANQTLNEIPQDNSAGQPFKPAPKLNKTNTRLNFNRTTDEIDRMVRGLSPYPGAYFEGFDIKRQQGFIVKVYSGEPVHYIENDEPIKVASNRMLVRCQDGYFAITELQVEGKKRMTTQAFLAGNSVLDWQVR